MSQRPVDIIRELASKVARRGLTWHQALRAAVSEHLVNPLTIRTAQVELGDEWAQRVYDNTARELNAIPQEEIAFDDTRISELMTDGVVTEPATLPCMSVNQLILTLAAMREQDSDVGKLRVVFGRERLDIAVVAVTSLRDAPTTDGDYALLIDGSAIPR